MKNNSIYSKNLGEYCFKTLLNSYINKEDIYDTLSNLVILSNKSLYDIIKSIYNYREQHYINNLSLENNTADNMLRNDIKLFKKYITKDMDIDTLKNIAYTYNKSLYLFKLYLKALSMPLDINKSLEIISIENNQDKDEILEYSSNYLVTFANSLDYKNYKNLLKKKRRLSQYDIYSHIISLVETSLDNNISINYIFRLIMTSFNLSKEGIISILDNYTHTYDFKYSKLSTDKKYNLLSIISNPDKIVTFIDIDNNSSYFCYRYFNLYLKALYLGYSIDYALKMISFEENVSIDDIKKYSKMYLDNYADKISTDKYNRAVKVYNNTNKKKNSSLSITYDEAVMLINYLNSNLSIEDYYNKNSLLHSKYSSAHFPVVIERIAKKNKELYSMYLEHEARIYTYEQSYFDTLIDTILPFLRYGVPTEDGNRPFTMLDYYFITTYSLNKLRANLSKYSMSIEDRKLLSSLWNKAKTTYEVNVDHFINSYNTTRYFNDTYRNLTMEEKIAIIEYFKDNNIPLYENFIEEFITNYAKGRVFIPKKDKNI